MGDRLNEESSDVRLASFSLQFDGEALKSGLMDVRELSPALLSIGKLCEDANRALNGDRAKVSVNVTADFKRGSFGIDLRLAQSLLEQAKSLILGHPVQDARQILETLGLASGITLSLIKFVKWLQGRKITEQTVLQSGDIRIVVEHAESVTVNNRVLNLAQRSEILRDLAEVTAPLKAEGIDALKVIENQTVVEQIDKKDVAAFESAPEALHEEVLAESTVDMVYKVLTLSFERQYIWRLSDGQSTINARIEDEEFFKAMEERRVSFQAGDMLRVRIHSRQERSGDGLSTTHRVLKVLEVIHASPPTDQQLKLGE